MKKIKTLIIDDDYLVLQDLKKLVDWEGLGFEIIDFAPNGKRALEITKKKMPDLIVSDISMPVMDGFDFIEMLKKLNPDIYIIFISSYASFDYARRALKNHVHSYILKNEITEDILRKELLQAKSYIFQNEFLQKEEIEKELKKYFELKDDNLVSDEEFLRRKFIFFFIAPHIPLQKLKSHFQYISEIGKKLIQDIYPVINQLYPDAYVFYIKEFVITAIPWEKIGKPFSCTSVSSAYRCLRDKIQKDQKVNVQIYSAPKKLSVVEARNVFEHLHPLLTFFNLFPGNATWDLSKFEGKTFSQISQGFSYDCVDKAIKNPEIFMREIENYATILFETMDADSIFMLYHNLVFRMEELSEYMIPIKERNFFNNKEDFIYFFEKTFKEIQQYILRKGKQEYAPWLVLAINFMKNNYSNSNLTVDQIAEIVGLSASRFSVLFRQETGQTVNDYLTEIRMAQAVFLLENSNLKIYEIAEKVGYKSSQYFSQIFFQKTGYKPLHFRKKKF